MIWSQWHMRCVSIKTPYYLWTHHHTYNGIILGRLHKEQLIVWFFGAVWLALSLTGRTASHSMEGRVEMRCGRRGVHKSMSVFFCSRNFWSWPAGSSSLQIQSSVRGPSSGTSWSPVERRQTPDDEREAPVIRDLTHLSPTTQIQQITRTERTLNPICLLHQRWKISTYITAESVETLI